MLYDGPIFERLLVRPGESSLFYPKIHSRVRKLPTTRKVGKVPWLVTRAVQH